VKRRRSPREKKKLDAKKQRRGFSEYAHAMRHGKWRKNKRRPAQQSERQAERTALSGLGQETLADPGFDPGVIRRPTIGTKWTGAALGEWIEIKKSDRAVRAGGKKRRAARKSMR
jgi:hypothetical protein